MKEIETEIKGDSHNTIMLTSESPPFLFSLFISLPQQQATTVVLTFGRGQLPACVWSLHVLASSHHTSAAHISSPPRPPAPPPPHPSASGTSSTTHYKMQPHPCIQCRVEWRNTSAQRRGSGKLSTPAAVPLSQKRRRFLSSLPSRMYLPARQAWWTALAPSETLLGRGRTYRTPWMSCSLLRRWSSTRGCSRHSLALRKRPTHLLTSSVPPCQPVKVCMVRRLEREES